MVVWEDGKMKKSDYRKFIIKTVQGVDDFATMREVVTRRYKRLQDDSKQMPSLILIDGGIGQLHAAAEALEAIGVINQPLASIAKREEIIYVHGREDEPVSLDHHSPGAAHRAADSRRSPPLRRHLPSQAPRDARPLNGTTRDPRRRRAIPREGCWSISAASRPSSKPTPPRYQQSSRAPRPKRSWDISGNNGYELRLRARVARSELRTLTCLH